jgi:hypothetical protein
MQEITRILSKYGEALDSSEITDGESSGITEVNETAFPKLLHCLIEMEEIIFRLKKEREDFNRGLSNIFVDVADTLAEKVKDFLVESVAECARSDIDTKDKKL